MDAAGALLGPAAETATSMGAYTPAVLIVLATLLGLAFASFLWTLVAQVKVGEDKYSQSAALLPSSNSVSHSEKLAAEIQEAISLGSTSFLQTEYKYMGVFMAGFSVIIFLFLGGQDGFSTKATQHAAFSTIAFINGAATSILCGCVPPVPAPPLSGQPHIGERAGGAPPPRGAGLDPAG